MQTIKYINNNEYGYLSGDRITINNTVLSEFVDTTNNAIRELTKFKEHRCSYAWRHSRATKRR